MKCAFVVRLGPKTNPDKGIFEGCVEEVDSGKQLKFHSEDELLAFLAERFLAARSSASQNAVTADRTREEP